MAQDTDARPLDKKRALEIAAERGWSIIRHEGTMYIAPCIEVRDRHRTLCFVTALDSQVDERTVSAVETAIRVTSTIRPGVNSCYTILAAT